MTPENINLVPRRLLTKRGNRRKVVLGGIALIAVAAVVTFSFLLLDTQAKEEERKLVVLQGQETQLQSAIQTYQVFQQDESNLRAQEQLVSNTKKGETLWSEVLDHISLIIPDDVQLDSFHGDSSEGASFRINGTAPDFEGVATLLIRLRASEQFANVLLNGTTLADGGVVGFDFSATVIDPEGQLEAEGG